MFAKHIKAACLAITLGLIAVMFLMVTVLNGEIIDSANPTGAIMLLIVAVGAMIPVFVAHEKRS